MEWIWCKDCLYVDDCIEATRADGCYAGEREDEVGSVFTDLKIALQQTINLLKIKEKGYDYYITDELGGVHTDGVGYAPDGAFCGECTRESCSGCPAWDKEN